MQIDFKAERGVRLSSLNCASPLQTGCQEKALRFVPVHLLSPEKRKSVVNCLKWVRTLIQKIQNKIVRALAHVEEGGVGTFWMIFVNHIRFAGQLALCEIFGAYFF